MNLIIILAALICFAQPARAEEEPASNLRHCMAITGQSEHDCRLQYARVVEHCITITGQSEHDCRLLYDKAVASVESYFVGLTDPQIEAINAVVVARVAGGRWQRCPRFHLIEGSDAQELYDAGVNTEKFKDAIEELTFAAMDHSDQTPSEFCTLAWHLVGPDGTYRRQMLEANG
jgi:hypothetical protein